MGRNSRSVEDENSSRPSCSHVITCFLRCFLRGKDRNNILSSSVLGIKYSEFERKLRDLGELELRN